MTTTNNTEALDTRTSEYHDIYPYCADFDLRIFKSMCEGKTADVIATEQSCSITSVSASLARLADYLTSGDLISIAEIFREMHYNASLDRPTPSTMLSVIDTLYYTASENGMVSNEDTQEFFSQLRTLTEQMPKQVAEDIFDIVCKICDVFEHVSFVEGVKIGFQLGKELLS